MKSRNPALNFSIIRGPSIELAMLFKKIPRILPFIGRRVGFWLGLMSVASLTLGFVEMAISWLLQFFLMTLQIIPSTSKVPGPFDVHPTNLQLAIGLIVVGAVRALCEFTVNHGASVALELLSSRLRMISLFEMLRSKKEKFISSSDMNHRLGEIFPKAALFCHYFSILASNLIQGAVLFLYMLYTSWQHSIIGLVGLAVVGLICMPLNRKVRAAARNIPLEQKHLISGVERIARNWLFVKVLRTEQREYNRLLSHTVSYSTHYIRSSFFGNASAVLPSVLGLYLVLVIIGADVKYWHSPGLTFITFLYIYLRFVQLVARTVGTLGQANTVWPNFLHAFSYFSQFERGEVGEATRPVLSISSIGTSRVAGQGKPGANAVGPRAPQLPPPAIAFQSVNFAYGEQGEDILRNFSLNIPAGSQLGIIGRSGSGKSTLLGLLLGLLQPTRGKIVVNGRSPRDYFTGASGSVGYVGAEPFLIEGSLRENLCYGAEREFSDEECYDALESARLKERVLRLPDLLNFHLTEISEGLSAGEKQRLALARALLNKPSILILDEASANLDEKTEQEIAEVIDRLKGSCTAIIVSHRPGILKNVDQLINLQEHRLQTDR